MPIIFITSAELVEGDSGQTEAVFEVRLSQPSEETGDDVIQANLLLNAGFESELTDWNTSGNASIRTGDPDSYEGESYLYGYSTSYFEVWQDIDLLNYYSESQLDGGATVNFGGWQSGWHSQSDYGYIIITFFSEDETEIGSFNTGEFFSNNTWTERSLEADLPNGTRSIRYQFVGTRVAGSNNDAYLDAAFVNITLWDDDDIDQGVAPVAADDDFSTDEDTALTGYVLLDNGNGADSDADGDALTVSAVAGKAENVGRTITLGSGALLTLNADGSFAYDPNGQFDGLAAGETTTDSFEYTVSDGTGGEDTARGTIEFSGVNDAPVGGADAFTAEEDTEISGNVFDDNGSGADFDPEGRDITAALETPTANGSIELNEDGSFVYTPHVDYVGTDTFTYTISDGETTSDPVTVSLTMTDDGRGPFSTILELPDAMPTGEIGTTTITYTNDSAKSYDRVLILVEITGGLLADPQTGAYSDSLLLIGEGDGEGEIEYGESGILELDTKLVNYPGQDATVTVSVNDPDESIDWSSRKELLKPEFLSDEAWDRIFENFIEALGDTGKELVDLLAENIDFLEEYGVNGSNATTALAFELEQAGDFGSLAERSAEGSMGDGWAFIGNLKLEISQSTGTIALTGSTDFSALFDLSAENCAYYIVSSSVDQAVTLGGGLVGGVPKNRPTFSLNTDGAYTASGDFSGELIRTDDGYEIETDSGLTLYFDADGNFFKATDRSGLETTAVYDDGKISGFLGAYGETLTITRNASGQVTSIGDASGDSVELSYTEELLTEAVAVNTIANFTYDTDGYLAGTTATGEPVTAFIYDDDGRLHAIDVGSGTETATYVYDSFGGYTVTDGAGRVTHVALVPSGSVTAVTNGLGETTVLLYDESGTLTGIALADGSVVDITVDDLGRITAITDAEGATVSYTYEGDATSPATFTDVNGNTRTFTYNDLGQMTSAQWPDGTSLTFTWGDNGNLESYTTRSGETITYAYDNGGNLTFESDGTTGETSYVYDDSGQLISATTDAGTTTISYDDAGNVTAINYPGGGSLSYTYDAASNRTSMTDQEGNTQTYTWDEAGRLASMSNDDGLLVAYTYDPGGNLIQEENGNGTITTYSYDGAGQLVEIMDLDAGGGVNSYVIYTYDALGQRISMETEDGTWTYGYDDSGQLTSADFVSTNPVIDNSAIQYNYDDAGNRTSVVEDGVETVYVTNELNQYISVGDESYTYDDNGNFISKTDEDGNWAYTYDVDNRLTMVISPSGDVTEYAYDVFGNRCALIENGVETSYLIDPFGLGNVVAQYDEDGDQVTSYVNGLGLVAQVSADGFVGYYNTDGVYSVTGITDTSGELVNQYVYTPFGDELYESETIDNGYEFNGGLGVYEDDNELIYMRARYYDPEDGRFISEDPLWLDGDEGNLYRFAFNNPTSYVDADGEIGLLGAILVSSGIVSFSISVGTALYATSIEYQVYQTQIAASGGATTNLTANMLGRLVNTAGYTFKETFKALNNRWISLALDVFEIIPKNADELDGFVSSVSDFIAWATGDPHLKTFDGLYYDFQGAGEFSLVQGEDLEIQIRTEPWGSSTSVTVITAVAIQVGDAVVGIYLDNSGKVNINGEFVELEVGETFAVEGGGIYRSDTKTYVVVNENGDGFQATAGSTYLNIYSFLSEDREGGVSGLLGNADGDTSNDIALSDGTVLSESDTVSTQVLYTDYADSWRITDETSLFVYEDGESTATYTIENFPVGVITVDDLDADVREAAEEVALAAGLVEGTVEFDAAVLDVALTGDESFAEGTAEYGDAAIISLGDAPDRLPRTDLDAWHNAWTSDGITITQKAEYDDDTEAWINVVLSGNGGSELAGGDMLSGDLGVSGTTIWEDGTEPQELDGTQALKFELEETAEKVTIDLARFYLNDDGSGNSESIRVQAFGDGGNLVEERVVSADSATGESAISFDVEEGFSALVITSGAYEGDQFIFGSLADSSGSAIKGGSNSECVIDAIQFVLVQETMEIQTNTVATYNEGAIPLAGVYDTGIDDIYA